MFDGGGGGGGSGGSNGGGSGWSRGGGSGCSMVGGSGCVIALGGGGCLIESVVACWSGTSESFVSTSTCGGECPCFNVIVLSSRC